MQKISSIIPSNNRISTVDLSRSQPVRQGTPSFGRAVVTPSNHRQVAKSSLDEGAFTYNQYSDSKAKMRIQSQMVDQLADRFFREEQEKMKHEPQVEISAPQTQNTSHVGKNLDVIA